MSVTLSVLGAHGFSASPEMHIIHSAKLFSKSIVDCMPYRDNYYELVVIDS